MFNLLPAFIPLFEQLLVDISSALRASSIPHMIIGGQAVLVYGEPRLTRDIDITLGVDVDELERVQKAIAALSLSTLTEDPQSFAASTHVLPLLHEESGIRVDLIFSFSPYEQEALKRVTGRSLQGFEVPFASLEDIIIHKLVAGRPRDIEDIRGILARNHKRDDPYVLRWLDEFGKALERPLREDYQKLLAERSNRPKAE